jgi:hypothetical protein
MTPKLKLIKKVLAFYILGLRYPHWPMLDSVAGDVVGRGNKGRVVGRRLAY